MNASLTIKLYESLKTRFDKETAQLIILYIEELIEFQISKKMGLKFKAKLEQ